MSTSVRQSAQGEPVVYPTPAAIAVVVRDGGVLLVRRANPPQTGCWGFPGGKIEVGETIEAAAVRELNEETAVKADACRIITAVDVFGRDGDGRLLQHFVLIAVLCKWVGGEPVAADDALEARWLPLEDLDEAGLALHDDVARIARVAAELACG